MDINISSPDSYHTNIYTEQVNEYIKHSKADNTLRAYRFDWSDFVSWCDENGLESLCASPETVCGYLIDLVDNRGYKTSTLQRRLISIRKAHVIAGYDDVTKHSLVKETLAGIRRVHGAAQTGKTPAITQDIRMMVNNLPENLKGCRDRVLILTGFAGSFRRSELVSLDFEDLEFVAEGLIINLRKSKTDQEGKGRKIGIPYGSRLETCPVRNMQKWLERSEIKEGPLFCRINKYDKMIEGKRLCDKSVALIVKRCAEAAGLNPNIYSGHSLRSGFATSAAMNGASLYDIMRQTGHLSETMVRKYIRDGNLFNNNAVTSVGL